MGRGSASRHRRRTELDAPSLSVAETLAAAARGTYYGRCRPGDPRGLGPASTGGTWLRSRSAGRGGADAYCVRRAGRGRRGRPRHRLFAESGQDASACAAGGGDDAMPSADAAKRELKPCMQTPRPRCGVSPMALPAIAGGGPRALGRLFKQFYADRIDAHPARCLLRAAGALRRAARRRRAGHPTLWASLLLRRWLLRRARRRRAGGRGAARAAIWSCTPPL